MPGEALRGRACPLSLARSVRLLACDFALTADTDDVLIALDRLVQHAVQRFPVSRVHRLAVRRTDDGYHLALDDHEFDRRADAPSAADGLFWRMHDLALAALPDFTKVHAGCATWNGQRLLVVGPARAGKTTLMTRLLFEGFAVHCDDTVLLRRGEVLPFPRRFRVRSSAIPMLRQLLPLTVRAMVNGGLMAVDPTELGFAWEIDLAPVDAVFFLEPNHGGETRLESCPKHVMAQRIMGQSNMPAAGARDWVRDVVDTLDRAACHVLRSGDLEASVSAVKRALRL